MSSSESDDPDYLILLSYLRDPTVIGYLQVADIHCWETGGPPPNLTFHPSTRYTYAGEAPAVAPTVAPSPAPAPTRAQLHILTGTCAHLHIPMCTCERTYTHIHTRCYTRDLT